MDRPPLIKFFIIQNTNLQYISHLCFSIQKIISKSTLCSIFFFPLTFINSEIYELDMYINLLRFVDFKSNIVVMFISTFFDSIHYDHI